MRDKVTASLLVLLIMKQTLGFSLSQDIQSMLIHLTKRVWICHLIFSTLTHYHVKDWIFSVNLQQQQKTI